MAQHVKNVEGGEDARAVGGEDFFHKEKRTVSILRSVHRTVELFTTSTKIIQTKAQKIFKQTTEMTQASHYSAVSITCHKCLKNSLQIFAIVWIGLTPDGLSIKILTVKNSTICSMV